MPEVEVLGQGCGEHCLPSLLKLNMGPEDLLEPFPKIITSCWFLSCPALHCWGLSLLSLHEQIVYAERPLTDNNRSLASYGLKDGDVVILRQKEAVEPRPSIRFPGEKGFVLPFAQSMKRSSCLSNTNSMSCRSPLAIH